MDTVHLPSRSVSIVAAAAVRARAAGATLRRLVAFTLIAIGTLVTKAGKSPQVMRPLMAEQVFRVGVKLVPIVCFLGITLGIVIVGQTVTVLQTVGAVKFTGMLLVTVVIRELAPLVAGLVVLARVGTASVIELATARALGEVEAFVHVGTALPVTAITEQIEKRFRKPLIGVNVATYWSALRAMGIKDQIKGFGKLLAEH